MSRARPWLLAGWLSGCAAAGSGEAPAPEELALLGRQSTILVGLRSFEDEGFDRLDDQLALGLDFLQPIGLRHLRLEGGLHYSFDEANGTESGGDGVELHSETYELTTGVNAAVLWRRLRPYLGAGGSLLLVNLRGIDASDEVFHDEDVTVGAYVKVGLLFQVTGSVHVGLELRHLEAGDLALGDDDVDGSYDQVVLVFGASF